MAEYIDRKEEIEIPRGSGIEGFVATIRKILQLSRVQYIHIENGKVSYTRSVRPEEPKQPLGVDFDSLLPSHIIRNTQLTEVADDETSAALAICRLLQTASFQHLHPIAFASGPRTHFWEWHRRSTGIDVGHRTDVLYGLPLLLDEQLPNEVLVLCAGYSKGAALVDTRFAFKITMPLGLEAPKP